MWWPPPAATGRQDPGLQGTRLHPFKPKHKPSPPAPVAQKKFEFWGQKGVQFPGRTLPKDVTPGQVTCPPGKRDANPPLETWWPGWEGICARLGGAPFQALSALPVPGRGPQLQSVLKLESSGCAARGAPTHRKWGLGGAELSNPQTPRAVHYLNTS